MNVFEGSRRVALLLALVVGAGTLLYAATYDPFVRLSYLISDPDVGFKRLNGACPPGLARDTATQRQDDTLLFLEFCVLETPEDTPSDRAERYAAWIVQNEGRKGTPEFDTVAKAYQIAKNEEASALERARANALRNARLRLAYRRVIDSAFVIPDSDQPWIREQASRRYWQQWRESLTLLAAGLAFFGALVWAIGWVVRGFMGIPRGMDKRPTRAP
jgi:hypothetical protein